ncbi:MAG TPA: 4-oxalocrotonate tautomerase DmpI [Actinocatenispora sp.]
MPAVTIQQGPRPVELKRDLIRKITDAMVETYQIPAETVMVFIEETPTDSFGVAGRLAADR